MDPDNMIARGASSPSMDVALRYAALGGLFGAVGGPSFEHELLRDLTQMFHLEYVHICHFPAEQPQMLLSVAEDSGRSVQE
ncbi:hypothetical protein F9288_16865 [Sphingomonas sp. CL5.1]|uniref:hypothetical protein n=1 Tax=Sphingomonas sp. CL5.1 TaxID=2653203 RepID=UPI001583EAB5|nr:hypothetical protein [Sphingomonas sp. CL5.1]QKS01113.1 hypothetical protein F9288_16865 [Sphingomonas sp. CL5.1]